MLVYGHKAKVIYDRLLSVESEDVGFEEAMGQLVSFETVGDLLNALRSTDEMVGFNSSQGPVFFYGSEQSLVDNLKPFWDKYYTTAKLEASGVSVVGGKVKRADVEKALKIISNVDNTLKKFKDIVTEHAAEEIDGVLVDVTTANAIVTVAEGLSEENRNKFLNLPITKMASVAWKVLEKAKS